MEIGDPTLYYGTKNYSLGISISNSQGVVTTFPLGRWEGVLQKKKAQEDEG